MKRVDLIKKIKALGCVFIRHGGKHDWYQSLIKRHLARHILKMLGEGIHG